MESVAEIIDALGGSTAFGRICGFDKNPGARGSDMRQRGSIPVIYWPSIVEHAQAQGVAIDNDVLVRAHQRRGEATSLERSGGRAKLNAARGTTLERAKPLRCIGPHGSAGLATEGQSR